MQDIQEILSFPDHTFHRIIDKAVLEAGAVSLGNLKIATIALITVYNMSLRFLDFEY